MKNETNEKSNSSSSKPLILRGEGDRVIMLYPQPQTSKNLFVFFEGENEVMRLYSKASNYSQLIRNFSGLYGELGGLTIAKWLAEGRDAILNKIEVETPQFEEDYDTVGDIPKSDITIIGNPKTAKTLIFARKSDDSQSKYDLESAVKRKVRRTHKAAAVCYVGSSFKKNCFLHFLKNYLQPHHKLEIFKGTRTASETVSRNPKNAIRIIEEVENRLLDNVVVNGINLLIRPYMFIFIVAVDSGKWLSNANTKYAAKHIHYLDILLNRNEKPNDELLALIRYNDGIRDTIDYFVDLYDRTIENAKNYLATQDRITKAYKAYKTYYCNITNRSVRALIKQARDYLSSHSRF